MFWSPTGAFPYLQHGKDIFGSLPLLLAFFHTSYWETTAAGVARMGRVRTGLPAQRTAMPDGTITTAEVGPDPPLALLPATPASPAAAAAVAVQATVAQLAEVHKWRLTHSQAGWRQVAATQLSTLPTVLRPLLLPYVRYLRRAGADGAGLSGLAQEDLRRVAAPLVAGLATHIKQAANATEGPVGAPFFLGGRHPSAADAWAVAYLDCVLRGPACPEKVRALHLLPAPPTRTRSLLHRQPFEQTNM